MIKYPLKTRNDILKLFPTHHQKRLGTLASMDKKENPLLYRKKVCETDQSVVEASVLEGIIHSDRISLHIFEADTVTSQHTYNGIKPRWP
ncbi:hypothetical protein TNCT_662591 [Trichonephila clavata]|uniref:Uncharacterized protein n=1 Tax=Trichonephila clavata TaxID=2740835 RepID=A0A8X6LJE7_TRICU|nr:hypothetical protein TNCT_662591 [Trichonephila clavata]